ncbi:RHS repeat domain-containing protein [Nakamurella antarctica]|uniref:RHS repeat domain-containing protein n=1 Tax=Nakamurella antarctica TaxID=1902245 RepID=UPI0019D1BAFF|nr:RHS repeat domain-containing protein [Nakamurella antarctica]
MGFRNVSVNDHRRRRWSLTEAYTFTDAGAVDTITLDGALLSDTTFDAGTGEVTGAVYGNTTTGEIGRFGNGALQSLTWTLNGATIGDTVTRSQSGRVTGSTQTSTLTPAANNVWSYTYDPAGNLGSAVLAANASRPRVEYSYGFSGSASSICPTGTSVGAAANTNRTVSTYQLGAVGETSRFCYDAADRILAVTGAKPTTYTYDSRGNVSTVTDTAGVTTFVYDSSNRHVKTIAPNGSGGTVTITYIRDTADRVTARIIAGSATPAENGTFLYGFTSTDDSADLDLGAGNVMITRINSLPGGVTYTKNYQTVADSRWHYPNIHGDNIATTLPTGTIDGTVKVYDPYGAPITAGGAPDFDAVPEHQPVRIRRRLAGAAPADG